MRESEARVTPRWRATVVTVNYPIFAKRRQVWATKRAITYLVSYRAEDERFTQQIVGNWQSQLPQGSPSSAYGTGHAFRC
jgi:hypothetical protein